MPKMAIAFLIILVASVYAADIEDFDDDGPEGRVIGGLMANTNEFPDQVSFQFFQRHSCTASIISSTKILTAAHCVDKIIFGFFYRIVTGITRLSDAKSTSQIRKISKIRIHSEYNFLNFKNDIAILTLSEPLKFNKAVKAINLPKVGTEFETGEKLVLTGWGKTSFSAVSASDNLLKVIVPVVSAEVCRNAYGNIITNKIICAGTSGKGACFGDSGGGLATFSKNRTLIGITSFGSSHGCALEGFPEAYTKVSAYRQWIRENSGV